MIQHKYGCRAADPLQKLPWRRRARLDDRGLGPHDEWGNLSRRSVPDLTGRSRDRESCEEENAFLFLEDQNQKYLLGSEQELTELATGDAGPLVTFKLWGGSAHPKFWARTTPELLISYENVRLRPRNRWVQAESRTVGVGSMASSSSRESPRVARRLTRLRAVRLPWRWSR